MNNIYSLSTVVLAHGLQISGSSRIFLLIVMSLFVFGPLLFKEAVRMPKGLFISSFISYALVLVNILVLSLKSWIPIEVAFPFLMVVYPYFHIVGFIEDLMERLFGQFGPVQWIISNQEFAIFLVAFIINTLCIFAIIRLFLYIRKPKKPRVKQTV